MSKTVFGLLSLGVLILVVYSVSWDPPPKRPPKMRQEMGQITAFLTALNSYREDIGAYPKEEQGLSALFVNPGVVGWRGPYLRGGLPGDSAGRAYRYRVVDGRPWLAGSLVDSDGGR